MTTSGTVNFTKNQTYQSRNFHGKILLFFFSNQKWAPVGFLFSNIDIKFYHEMNEFVLKMAETVTEMDHSEIKYEALDKFMKELMSNYKLKIYPIHQAVLSQFGATLIMHFDKNFIVAKEIVIQCLKYQLYPWQLRTMFNPEAESEAIFKRHPSWEVLLVTLKALTSSRDYEMKAYDLIIYYKNVIFQQWSLEDISDISISLMEKLIQLQVDKEFVTNKMNAMCTIFDQFVHQTAILKSAEIGPKMVELFNQTVMDLLDNIEDGKWGMYLFIYSSHCGK